MELKKNNLTEQLFNLLNNRKQKDARKLILREREHTGVGARLRREIVRFPGTFEREND